MCQCFLNASLCTLRSKYTRSCTTFRFYLSWSIGHDKARGGRNNPSERIAVNQLGTIANRPVYTTEHSIPFFAGFLSHYLSRNVSHTLIFSYTLQHTDKMYSCADHGSFRSGPMRQGLFGIAGVGRLSDGNVRICI